MSTQTSDVARTSGRAMGPKTIIKLVATAIVALLVLIVIIQNTEHVDTHVLFWEFNMPRVVLLFLTLVVGFAMGITAAVMYTSPRRR
ncbi:MAG: lipopolysaccharide assembly protein LapA domain-containing protein [Phycisphaeraceae bacterium]